MHGTKYLPIHSLVSLWGSFHLRSLGGMKTRNSVPVLKHVLTLWENTSVLEKIKYMWKVSGMPGASTQWHVCVPLSTSEHAKAGPKSFPTVYNILIWSNIGLSYTQLLNSTRGIWLPPKYFFSASLSLEKNMLVWVGETLVCCLFEAIPFLDPLLILFTTWNCLKPVCGFKGNSQWK